MKPTRWFTFTLAAVIVAGGLFSLSARPAGHPRAPRPVAGKFRERVKEKLGLTGEQITEIKGQLKGERKNIRSLATRLHDAHSGLRAEIQKPEATETSVREASAKLAAVESDLAVERQKLRAKISPILTAEQNEKLNQLRAGRDRMVDRIIHRVHDKTAE